MVRGGSRVVTGGAYVIYADWLVFQEWVAHMAMVATAVMVMVVMGTAGTAGTAAMAVTKKAVMKRALARVPMVVEVASELFSFFNYFRRGRG